MSTKIAQTTFESDGKDVIPVVDAYTAEPVTVPLNRVVTTVEAARSRVADDTAKVATESIDKAKNALTQFFDPDNMVAAVISGKLDDKLLTDIPTTREDAMALVARATGGGIGQLNGIKDMKGALLESLLGSVGYVKDPKALAAGILGLPGSTDPINLLVGENPKLKILYDTVTYVRNADDLDTATGAIEMVNTITGDSELAKVLHLEGTFGVIGTLATRAEIAGIPGLFDAIVNNVREEDRRDFMLQNAKALLTNQDPHQVTRLREYVDIADLKARVPEPADYLLSIYRIPKDAESMADEGNALITMLFQLGWELVSARPSLNGVDPVYELKSFMGASKDAIKVLLANTAEVPPVIKVMAGIAKSYKKTGIRQLVKRDFPKAPVFVNAA